MPWWLRRRGWRKTGLRLGDLGLWLSLLNWRLGRPRSLSRGALALGGLPLIRGLGSRDRCLRARGFRAHRLCGVRSLARLLRLRRLIAHYRVLQRRWSISLRWCHRRRIGNSRIGAPLPAAVLCFPLCRLLYRRCDSLDLRWDGSDRCRCGLRFRFCCVLERRRLFFPASAVGC